MLDFTKLDDANDKKMVQFQNEIVRNYQVSLKKVKYELSSLYGKYDTLSLAEVNRYNDLLFLFQSLQNILNENNEENKNKLYLFLKERYKENKLESLFLLQKESITSFLLFLDEVAIESFIKNNESGASFLERYDKLHADTFFKLKESITQGIILSQSYKEISKNVENILGTSASHSNKIVITEVGRALSESRLDALRQANEEGLNVRKMWVSTLDGRTRKSHQKLDGQIADVDGYFHLGSKKAKAPRLFHIAKEDINCRCRVVGVFDDDKPMVRTARKSDGKNETIKYKTYAEWKRGNGF